MTDKQAQALWDAIESIVATETQLTGISQADLVRELSLSVITQLTNHLKH